MCTGHIIQNTMVVAGWWIQNPGKEYEGMGGKCEKENENQ